MLNQSANSQANVLGYKSHGSETLVHSPDSSTAPLGTQEGASTGIVHVATDAKMKSPSSTLVRFTSAGNQKYA